MAIIFSALVRISWSCVSPGNIEGVAFTSNEEVRLDNLTSLGEEGVNYLTDGEGEFTAVRYRSHYNERAMVYVGTYGISYQEGLNLPCMGVILDPEMMTEGYTLVQEDIFDFSEAVMTELRWLIANGVIELSQEAISAIDSSLRNAQNGGIQYWTLQNAVLGYNAWYNYDTLSGVWGVDGEDGVSGVNAVRAVNSIGCSVIDPAFELISAFLGEVVSVTPVKRAVHAVTKTKSATFRDKNLIINLSHPLSTRTRGQLLAINGRVIVDFFIPANVHEVRLDLSDKMKWGAGTYLLQWGSFKQVLNKLQ